MNRNSLNWALKQTARRLSVSQKLVEDVYNSYWCFIREHIMSLPLKTSSEEEIRELTTNFNLPFIGKLYVDYDQITKYHNQLKFYNNVKDKEDKASRLSSVSD